MSPMPTAAARRSSITWRTITASARACCWRCWNTSHRRFPQPILTAEYRGLSARASSSWSYKGLFLQLAYAANLLNNGYYRYRENRLTIDRASRRAPERFDPWQNAATVSLHVYFNTLVDYAALRPGHLAGWLCRRPTANLFGDPWQNVQPHIPGSLEQPAFLLPFEPGDVWALTGGPHTGWGTGEPLAALDFAPPSKIRRLCVQRPSGRPRWRMAWSCAPKPGR